MPIHVNQCNEDTQLNVGCGDVNGDGYSSMKCHICTHSIFQCNKCNKVYLNRRSDHRFIRRHVETHQLPDDPPVLDMGLCEEEDSESEGDDDLPDMAVFIHDQEDDESEGGDDPTHDVE